MLSYFGRYHEKITANSMDLMKFSVILIIEIVTRRHADTHLIAALQARIDPLF